MAASHHAAPASEDFQWTAQPEPHAQRRREILEKYPAARELYGPCGRTKYVCLALLGAQLALAFALRSAPWWLVALTAYSVGGVINHTLLLAIHELSHNLAFRRPVHNRLFALLANLPIGIPVAATFRHYHLLHHVHQGEDGVDTDLPTAWEGRWVRGRVAKLLWLALQGFAYGLRPLVVRPKRPDRWELANLVLQLAFDLLVLELWGLRALIYLPLGSLLAMGLHPVAGHFVAEHYVFRAGQETYSYYGPLNRLTFNVGYHNEHHDFPYIAGSRLPQLHALAPEYYANLYHHRSWSRVLRQYVLRPDLSAHCRVKRAARGDPALEPSPRPAPTAAG